MCLSKSDGQRAPLAQAKLSGASRESNRNEILDDQKLTLNSSVIQKSDKKLLSWLKLRKHLCSGVAVDLQIKE
jgi:hypothetical protein